MSKLRPERVLVTGADGFIGSHVVEEFLASGYDVRAFVFYNSFNSWGWLDTLPPDVLARVDIRPGDIRDPAGVEAAVADCTHVLHLAALVSIPFSYGSPGTFIDTNVTGTLNVLQAARRHGIRRVVVTSTSEVYGSARFTPMTEEHPLSAQSPYAASKVAADQLALSFWCAYDLPVTVLRPFNAYGPRQSARAIIPTIITQALTGQALQLGSLTPRRDFTFVTDTARAFVLAMNSADVAGQVLNVGSGFDVSVQDIVDTVSSALDRPLTVEVDPTRVRPSGSEVDRLHSDSTMARDRLGWEPAFGGREGFRRGIAKTIVWLSRPENARRYKPFVYNT